MQKALQMNPLDQKRMVFIDCVSGYAFPIEENVDEAFYHKPPQTLEEMKEIIKFGISKINPDMIIIDSLSQFINFTKSSEDDLNELYEFLNSIKSDTMNLTRNSFILLYDTKLSTIQQLPKITTDNILKIEIINK